MIVVFGVINNDGCLIDASLTLLGAKQHATRNGYKRIGKRCEYNVVSTWVKDGKKWRKVVKN